MRFVIASLFVPVLTAALAVVPTASVSAAPTSVGPTVTTVAITPTSNAQKRAASSLPGGRIFAASASTRAVGFDVAGVTFDGPPTAGLMVQARTHTVAGWSGWVELGLDDDGPDADSSEGRRARAGTAPLAAAGSDGMDVRVSSRSGAVPRGLVVNLVDGGRSPADASTGSAARSLGGSVPGPSVITRAGWGADESQRNCTPDRLAGFKAAVVHHTVNSNSYSTSQAASLVRGIYAYHTRSLKWCDVGYQFLVDRFGRVYEGRKGSTTGFIVGAQSGGFNDDTFGVSVIGDFTNVPFPSAVTSAVSRVVAWQADRSAFDPAASVTLTSAGSTRYAPGVLVTKPRVMGHRDLSLTECPGADAYPQVPSIRSSATAQWNTGQYVQPAARFTAVTARRVLDTRRGLGAPRAALGPGRSLVLTVPGLPSNTTAVTLNLTGASGTATTYVAAYPAGVSRRSGSTLNPYRGQTTATQVTVGVSPGNTVRLYNSSGSIELIADLEGYFTTTSSAGFTPTTPRRVLDTRSGTGAPRGKVKKGTALTLAVPGLPSTATSVKLNLTATGVTANTVVTAYPGGRSRPATSVLNPRTGDTVANLVTVPVGPGGTVSLYSSSADLDLVADLAGYYSTGAGSRFVAVSPRRVLDTRYGFYAPWRPVAPSSYLTLPVSGIPTTAKAVSLSLTATNIRGHGTVLAYPSGVARPAASTLNPVTGRTVANFVTSGLGSGGSLTLYNGSQTLDLFADLTGYFIS